MKDLRLPLIFIIFPYHFLPEVLLDPDLKRYSVMMLDEAHERPISTQVLFALLKKSGKAWAG